MNIPASTKDLTKIPEALRASYKQEGDTWVLQLEGEHPELVSRQTLQEFRTNNINLLQEKKTLEEKLAAAEKVRQEKEELEKKGKDSTSKIDQLAEQMKTLIDNNNKLEARLRQTRVTDKLRAAALAKGVKPEAADDLLMLVAPEWDEDNGQLVRKVNGQPKLSEKRPAQPESPEEFFETLAKNKPFFYSSSNGDGPPATTQLKTTPAGKILVDPSDPVALGKHAEDLASGKAVFIEK